MIKEKLKLVGGFLAKNSKIALPIVLVLLVAVVVAVVLGANDERFPDDPSIAVNVNSTEGTTAGSAEVQPTEEPKQEETKPEDYVLEVNGDLRPLMCTYYNAYALGDMDTIRSVTNYLDETEAIRMQAMSEYVETYPEITVYSKPGPVENSYLAYVYYKMTVTNFEDAMSGMETFYVCTKEDGTLYLNQGDVSDEELEYIRIVNSQDDVVELYNRVTVECNDTFLKNSDLFYYVQEIMNDVQKTTGETLAAQMGSSAENSESNGEGEGTVEINASEGEVPVATEVPAVVEPAGPIYAKATTTVNVRVSDSEQADKAGKVSGGTKVEVLAQQVNGWTKIKGKDIEGYIKSEYLQLMNTEALTDAIGTVTASSNVNVRASASEGANRLGVLAGGENAELLGRENGWCKINYNGQVGYVKEDYVQ